MNFYKKFFLLIKIVYIIYLTNRFFCDKMFTIIIISAEEPRKRKVPWVMFSATKRFGVTIVFSTIFVDIGCFFVARKNIAWISLNRPIANAIGLFFIYFSFFPGATVARPDHVIATTKRFLTDAVETEKILIKTYRLRVCWRR